MYAHLTFETPDEIRDALTIIRRNRLYTPGSGKIASMCNETKYYIFKKIALVMSFDGVWWKPFGVAVMSQDRYEDAPMEVNVWVKPKFRKQGFGTSLLEKVGAVNYPGLRCYDTGRAAKMLYLKNLPLPKMI